MRRADWFWLWSIAGAAIGSPLGAEPLVREKQFPDGKPQERYSYVLDAEGHEVKEGLQEEWYPSGKLKGRVPWKQGREEGAAVFYHPDGRKSYEVFYREGKKTGLATVWHSNGQRQWQAAFRDGKTHGVWREWYADGKKRFEAAYDNGVLDGRATWWHANGRIQQERKYSAGKTLPGSVRAWNETGALVFPNVEGGFPSSDSTAMASPAKGP
jgi:antitoxin component YwqK of YwqJK toxin-antitoxin module